jgi:hypothetical protein
MYSVPVALGTYYDDLPTREFIVEDVRVHFKCPLPMMAFLIVFLLLGRPCMDLLSPGSKHPGKPLRPWHGIRGESWT